MRKDPKKLLERYKDGSCSDEEKAIVESWYLELKSEEGTPTHTVIENTKDKVWAALSTDAVKPTERPNLKIVYLRKVAAWAAAIFIIGSVGLFFLNKSKVQQVASQHLKKNDVLPGGNKAFLTLADGRKISLTDAENGELAKQEGLVIKKTADGQLVYTVAASDKAIENGTPLFNTIETPNGGKYQINLPDGTKVWLNAASSLRYPTKFTGTTRMVELKGEGYFEVAKVMKKGWTGSGKTAGRVPFIVKTAHQEVEVLGTHFNINGYKDEADIKTTLLEGSVRVSLKGDWSNPTKTSDSKLLSPGQQSQLSEKNINVKAVDVESVMAWKAGDFIFDGDDLKSIMRKIARWYDVEVIYKGEFENLKFGGLMSRSKNISSVLGIMESTGRIHFTVEGKRVTVLHNEK